MTNETKKQNALTEPSDLFEQYRSERLLIDDILSDIADGLDGHAEAYGVDPKNWGYLGDLKDIAAKLNDIRNRLLNEGEYA